MKIFKTAFLLGCKTSDKRLKNSKIIINRKLKYIKGKNNYNVFDYYEIGKVVNLISREY